MQNERQLSDSIVFIPSPYSVRQRFASASLSLLVTGTMSVSMAAAHTTSVGWNPPTTPIATHTVVTPTVHASTIQTSAAHILHAVQAYVPPVNHSTNNTSSSQVHSSTATTPSTSHTHTTSNSAALLFNHPAAATTATTPAKNDLDLNSATAMFTAGTLANFTSISIVVGGKSEQVNLNTKLTAAELLATQQVLSGQKQTIDISNTGTATGGTFNVNSTSLAQLDADLGGSIGALYIPHNVRLVDSVGALNIGGALTNHGSIITKGVDTIDAASILNASGAKLTAGSITAPSSLTLDTGSLINNGTINATGALNVAADTLSNSGTLSAAQAVSLNVPAITNTGIISSTHSNVNFTSTQNIALTNTGGTVQAKTGDINFRTDAFTGSASTTVTGGALNSQNVNFNAGNGALNANVDSITGRVNAVADTAHITAASGTLTLGNQDIKEDPTYFNTSGNVTINGLIQTNGNALAIVASGNIISGSYANEGIDTSSLVTTGNVNGGDITLIAGSNFSSNGSSSGNNDTGTTLTLLNSANAGKGSITGGYIDLDGLLQPKGSAVPLTAFASNSAAGAAGDVLIVAYHGTAANSGSVILQGLNSNTQLLGASTAQNGNLTIIADGGSSATTAGSIQLGNVEAKNIDIFAATPNLTSSVSITDGVVSSPAAFTASSTQAQSLVQFATLTAANVTVSTANAVHGGVGTNPAIVVAGQGGAAGTSSADGGTGGSGGTVLINAGAGIVVNAIDASGGGGGGGSYGSSGNGGGGGNGGSITLIANGGNIQTSGALNVSGGGGGGAAGSDTNTFNGGSGGVAGTVTLSTPGSLIIGNGIYAVAGAAGGVADGLNGGGGGGAYGGGGGGGSSSGSTLSDGGGGGGGSYGGGGGGSNTGSGNSPVGGGGGSPSTLSGGAAGISTGTGIANPTAGGTGVGGNGGGTGTGTGGNVIGISGDNGVGLALTGATTNTYSGAVNLTFGNASFSGTTTAKLPITVDTSNLTLNGTASAASINVTNDSQIGSMTLNANAPLTALTVNAKGGDLLVMSASAAIANLTAAGTLDLDGNVNATTSSILTGTNIDSAWSGTVVAPTLTLQASGPGNSIDLSASTNNLTIQAPGANAYVEVNELASTAGATNILASNIGSTAGAGTLYLQSLQQINLNGAITTNGGTTSSGSISITATSSSPVGIAVNTAQTVVGPSGEISLIVGSNQSVTDATAKVIQASTVSLIAGSLGTAAAPIATKESTGITGSTTAGSLFLEAETAAIVAYIRDTSTSALTFVTSNSTAGQTLSLTSTSPAITLGQVSFNNVTLTDATKGASITLGTSTFGSVIGPTFTTGTVAITAAGNINASNINFTDQINGTKVTLVSTGGSVGDFSGGEPIKINAPVVSATASTGSVNVFDFSDVTLSGSASLAGVNAFEGSSNGLITTSGTISGANVYLAAGGALTLGGNVTAATSNATNTSAVLLEGANVTQTLATTKVTGGTITLETIGSGQTIGAFGTPINTAASSTLIVSSDGTANAFINQTGNVSIGDLQGNAVQITSTGTMKVLGAGTNVNVLNLTSTGLLTLGDGTTTANSLNAAIGTFTSTAGITVNPNFTVNGQVLGFSSGTGAIAVNGTITPTQSVLFNAAGKANLAVTGSGTVTVASGEALELNAGGAITVSASPSNNPLLPVLQQTDLNNVQITAGGAFTSPLSSITVGDSGQLILQVSSVVYNGSGTPGIFTLSAGTIANPGTAALNLTGPNNIILNSTIGILPANKTFNTFAVYSAGGSTGTGGTDSILTAGTLTAPTTAGSTGFTIGSDLILQGTKGLFINGDLDNQDSSGTYHSVTLTSGATPFLVGAATTNGITGVLNGYSLNITDTAGIKISETVNAETNNGISLQTSSLTFGTGGILNAGTGTLQIINPAGALTVGAGGQYTNVGGIDVEAQKGALTFADANLLSLASSATTGVNSVTLMATGALTLPTTTSEIFALSNIEISVASIKIPSTGFQLASYSTNTAGSISLTTTSPLVVGSTDFKIDVAGGNSPTNTGNVILASSGNLTVDDSQINFGTGTPTGNLTLSGTNIAVSNFNSGVNYNNLSIASNSATAFTIGATTAAQKVNGIVLTNGGLTAANLTVGNSLGAIASNVSTGTTALTGTSSLTLIAKTGITGNSSTANLLVSTPSLSANIGSGTANLEVNDSSHLTFVSSLGAGAAGTINLQADDLVFFSPQTITASALNFTTATGGSFGSNLPINVTAKTISGSRLGFGFDGTSDLSLNDTNTGVTTIGAFAGTSNTAQILIQTAGAISVAGAITNLEGLTLGAGGTAGNITFTSAGSVSGTGANDVVNLAAVGTGTITNAAGSLPTIQTSQLNLANGTGAVSTTALRVDAPTLNLGGSGGFNILQLAQTSGEELSVSAVTTIKSLQYTAYGLTDTPGTVDTLVVGGAVTSNGGITIAGSANEIDINGNLLTTNGSIAVTDTINTATISVAQNVTIYGSSTTSGVGNVTMAIGIVPTAAQLTSGNAPANTQITNENGGKVYFGSTTYPTGSITVDAASTITANGRNAIFSAGAGTIELAGSDTIIADPPVGAALTVAPSTVVMPVTANTISTSSVQPAAVSTSNVIATPIVASPANGTGSLSNNAFVNAPTLNVGGSTVTLANLLSTASLVSSSTSPVQALVVNSQPAGSNNEIANNLKFSGSSSDASNKSLVGAVSNNSRLDNGATLIAADRNQVLQTEFGSVGIAKDALVLAIAFDHGIAVYNLHDSKRGAVTVNYRNHNIVLASGQHALLTEKDVKYFEQINPISYVGYRNLNAQDLGDGVKAFHAEFDIYSMIKGLEPLQAMFSSSDTQSRKVALNALKTAALITTMANRSKQFELMYLAPTTAMAIESVGH